jgi:hypothetical protein
MFPGSLDGGRLNVNRVHMGAPRAKEARRQKPISASNIQKRIFVSYNLGAEEPAV